VKNLIVVGDSFCAGQGWPQELAELLNLNLVVAGYGGHPWWACRHFLHQEEIKDIINEISHDLDIEFELIMGE